MSEITARIRVEDSVWREVKALATKNGYNVSDYVGNILKELLKNKEVKI